MAECRVCAKQITQSDKPGRPRQHCSTCRPDSKQKRLGSVAGCIYFIEAEGLDRFKIGYTAGTAEQRCIELQIGCPAPLAVVGSVPGSLAMERALHERFEHLRTTSEWFIANEELKAFVEEALAFSENLKRQMASYLESCL